MRFAALLILLAMKTAPALAGETACRLDRGRIVVTAAFGDVAGDFVLDAASPKSKLDDTVAGMWNLGEQEARADLRLAGVRLPGFVMQVAPLDSAGIAGVIGADALGGFVTEIRTAPCRVTLSRRAGRPWPTRLPLRVIGGAFATSAAVSDGVTSRAGWFAVATGAPGVTLTDAKLTRAPPKDADPDWPPARLRALSLGGTVLYENIPAAIADKAPAGLSGAIGEEAWHALDLRLDPRRGRLELAPSLSLPFSPSCPRERGFLRAAWPIRHAKAVLAPSLRGPKCQN
jgi:hypothetical protein